MKPAICSNGHHHLPNGQFITHGQEVDPNSLDADTLAEWLDKKLVVEYPRRRSYFDLFRLFVDGESAPVTGEALLSDSELSQFELT